jgi:hypothetical protein
VLREKVRAVRNVWDKDGIFAIMLRNAMWFKICTALQNPSARDTRIY